MILMFLTLMTVSSEVLKIELLDKLHRKETQQKTEKRVIYLVKNIDRM